MKPTFKVFVGMAGLAVMALGAYWVQHPLMHKKAKPHYTLQLLHASDMESDLSALQDVPYMSSLLRGFHAKYPEQTVIASAGDNFVPGPFYQASEHSSMRSLLGRVGRGRADILMLNHMGFQVSAFGNHEFDEGTPQLSELLPRDAKKGGVYEGTRFPYLCANINFRTDRALAPFVTDDAQEASKLGGKIASSAIITLKGTRIGFVGATTPRLAQISRPGTASISPADPDDMEALARIIQRAVDALTQQGIDKIILLSHMQQLSLELDLAGRLKDVDIIIGGGSDSILTDATDRLRKEDKSVGPYPIWKTSRSGQPTIVLSTDGQYRYVGRLVVGFDKRGLLLKHTINPLESGTYVTDAQAVRETNSPPPSKKVVSIIQGIRRLFIKKDGTIFGRTKLYLNGLRLGVRREETNLGNLTSDANLQAAQLADPKTTLAIKNGGAIRSSIGAIKGDTSNATTAQFTPPPANPITGKKEGDISQLDIENALKFNNKLILLTLTARQLIQIVEHGISTWTPNHTPGSFPQISGFAFSFDPRLPPGKRIRSLVILDKHGKHTDILVKHGSLQGNPLRTFRIVTLEYLFKGGDGYPFPKLNPKTLKPVLLTDALKALPGKANFSKPGTEQDAVAEYLLKYHQKTPYNTPDQPEQFDNRIQNLLKRKDGLLP